METWKKNKPKKHQAAKILIFCIIFKWVERNIEVNKNVDNIEVNKNEFHTSKQAIDLNLININKIVISEKFKHSDKGFKYFIGYKDDNIVRPLYILSPQMNEYIKCFENWGKNLSFMIEDDSVLVKYNLEET